MQHRNQLKRTILTLIFALFSTIFSFAQSSKLPEPRQEKLLNGLKLLIWTDATAPKVTIKIRIHGGSAFDPKDKMGVMALLSDIIFPTDQAKAYFIEDLEGSLDVTTNYDYIQITATGKSDELLAMIETFANAVANAQITKEDFIKVRDARLKKVQELEKNPAYMADLAVAKRLFGDFPYGRSVEGTSESLAKIDRADLLFAKERFLTSDNATIAIIGNVKPDYTYRAVRQLFGNWTKSDKLVPATFRQPDAPDTTILKVNSENSNTLEIRRAWRGLARNDKDFAAAWILTKLWQNRLGANTSLNFTPHILPGYYNLKISAGAMSMPSNNQIPMPVAAAELTKKSPNNDEFENAKTQILGEIMNNHISDLWLDVDTYKLVSVQNEIQSIQNVTIAEVKNVAEKLSKAATVTVLVAKPETTATKN